MSQDVSINIKICNRNYKIKVAVENEQIVRDSIHKIVENIDKFHQHFPGRDDQDYMAMTLIDFITSSNNNLSQSKNDQEIVKKIKHINQLLNQ